jgi:hypothetical protein
MSSATTGADFEFVASAGAATTPNSVAAFVTANMIRPLINFLPALAGADEARAGAWPPTMARKAKTCRCVRFPPWAIGGVFCRGGLG